MLDKCGNLPAKSNQSRKQHPFVVSGRASSNSNAEQYPPYATSKSEVGHYPQTDGLTMHSDDGDHQPEKLGSTHDHQFEYEFHIGSAEEQ